VKVLKFPLVKISICFVFGILFSKYTEPFYLSILVCLLVCFSATFFCGFILNKSKRNNLFFGIFSLLTSFFIGSFSIVLSNQTLNQNHYIHHLSLDDSKYISEIIITERIKSTAKNERYIADVIALNNKKSYGKILLNIRKNSTLSILEIGTHLKVNGKIYLNKNPFNPNQFDYGKYLENKQIYAQIYSNANEIKIGSSIEKGVNRYFSKLRNKIIRNLEKNNFNKTELSVVVALILGQQQDISKDIIQDYQFAGAVHVLSVSGLHVGCILLFITFLLKPIPNSNKGSSLKLILVLISLWSFGILAGMAPSVLRSVTMFSFVAIGIFLRRSVNIYHTLLVSMFLILLVQPLFLFDIGFQLSYLALFFIVWLQPLFASLWIPKYKILNYFWEIITVSFAAQIGTMPLSIYYFHQFPGLFFITNLIILPFLSFILGSGVLVMSLAAFDFVWLPLLKLLEGSIFILNKIIAWVASFENFILKDIPLNNYMMWSSYLVIISIIIWFKKPNFIKLAFSLIAIFVFQASLFYTKYSNNKEELIVFNKMKNTIITERFGNEITLFSNDSILKNADENLDIKSYLVANYCKIKKKEQLSNLFYFKENKIFLIDSSSVYFETVRPDILILTQSPKLNLERLFQSWKPKQVVADASNFKSYVKIWKTTCWKEKIPFHDTSEKGFYRLR